LSPALLSHSHKKHGNLVLPPCWPNKIPANL
jgi:hypothetical protein